MRYPKGLLAPLALISILAMASAAPVPAAPAHPSPTAMTQSGMVAGEASPGGERFLGIPYAAAPVGPLRWRAPQPPSSWKGLRPATAFGHDCMQEPYPSDAAPLGTAPAEDCLTINVWRPKGARAGARLPVMVWIYGGGSVNGGASPDVYSGDAFARDGVVFVSYNYRVGRFGFFGFPALARGDADKGLLYNYGYMDSVAALQWVRRNVAAFGGDPAKVTIYGQSAGAGQVAMLLGSPLARGLFRGAIIQSGGNANNAPTPAAEADKAGLAFAARWGIAGEGSETLARLRALSAAQVTDGIHIGTAAAQRPTFAGAVGDGKLLTGGLVEVVKAAREARVPLIIGSTTADNFAAMTAPTLDEAFATTFAPVGPAARAAYLVAPAADPGRVLREMGRDLSYNENARNIARLMTAQGLPVWRYRFGYVANAMRGEWTEGPPHATDIPFAMDMVTAKYGAATTAEDRSVAARLHAYWVNFVKTLDPNGKTASGEQLAPWPREDPAADRLMRFNPDGSNAGSDDPYHARIEAIARLRGH
ncbi:carboxylesterase family protein [Novosphingobium flavum]|uniref:Carboxylic ester hydrolase n=2 Tax=Novosphingobium flavum TaxID=1778672 RepID=A0A7X1FNQ3_9SPHN|nr:carboxylesterase family protein [Novosphingobium flavum]